MAHPSKLPESIVLSVRLTSCVTRAEAASLRTMAADQGLTVSQFIRAVMFGMDDFVS